MITHNKQQRGASPILTRGLEDAAARTGPFPSPVSPESLGGEALRTSPSSGRVSHAQPTRTKQLQNAGAQHDTVRRVLQPPPPTDEKPGSPAGCLADDFTHQQAPAPFLAGGAHTPGTRTRRARALLPSPTPPRPEGPALSSRTRTPTGGHTGARSLGAKRRRARGPWSPHPMPNRRPWTEKPPPGRPFSFRGRRAQGFRRRPRRVPPRHRNRRTPEPRGAPSAVAPTRWGSPAAPSPRGPAGLGLFPADGWRPARTRPQGGGDAHAQREGAPAGAERGLGSRQLERRPAAHSCTEARSGAAQHGSSEHALQDFPAKALRTAPGS